MYFGSPISQHLTQTKHTYQTVYVGMVVYIVSDHRLGDTVYCIHAWVYVN